jgi:hypothetical protein
MSIQKKFISQTVKYTNLIQLLLSFDLLNVPKTTLANYNILYLYIIFDNHAVFYI